MRAGTWKLALGCVTPTGVRWCNHHPGKSAGQVSLQAIVQVIHYIFVQGVPAYLPPKHSRDSSVPISSAPVASEAMPAGGAGAATEGLTAVMGSPGGAVRFAE